MLKTRFQDLCTRTDQQLRRCLGRSTSHERLGEAMRYSVLNGGKRIRPLLVYAANEALGGQPQSVDAAACAVELAHAYSLVHDDLPAIDNDALRRGKPSTHVRYDEATAILVGDALQSLAFQVLAESQHPQRLLQIRILSSAIGAAGMVAGQMADIHASGTSLPAAALEDMHIKKTGALIRASVLMGSAGNQASSADLKALEQYARNLGLAFQVKDDLLDVTGETRRLGKQTGADQHLDKQTYVSLYGIAKAEAILTELHTKAIEQLHMIGPEVDLLSEIADLTVGRDH